MHLAPTLGLALTLSLSLSLSPSLSANAAPVEPSPAASRQPQQPPPNAEQCRAQALDFFVSYGAASAPTLLRVYIDPTTSDQDPLRIWLEIQRIAGERGAELRVELITTRGGAIDAQLEPDRVRLWFMAAASLGHAEQALRVLDRLDWPRVATQLRSEAGRAELASAVGLEPAQLEALHLGSASACLQRSLDEGSRHIAAQTMGNPASIVGVMPEGQPEQFQYIDGTLSELRTQLDRLITAPSFMDESVGFVPFGPGLAGHSARYDRTFPGVGVLAGGEALPHRLVLFVEDEEHGRLPDWLAPAMQFRAEHPGQLSVQLISQGVGTRAINFRRRLCAARTLGLEVEYLLHLAQRPSLRRLHETTLYEVLQPVADSDACSDDEPLESAEELQEGQRSSFGHPRGAWLDGRPVNPSDLNSLEYQLETALHPSIIDWLSTPDAFAMDPMGFEF